MEGAPIPGGAVPVAATAGGGYGYHPLRALAGLVILVLLGWGIYANAGSAGALAPKERQAYEFFKANGRAPAHYEPLSPIAYSIENSLPLVKLGGCEFAEIAVWISAVAGASGMDPRDIIYCGGHGNRAETLIKTHERKLFVGHGEHAVPFGERLFDKIILAALEINDGWAVVKPTVENFLKNMLSIGPAALAIKRTGLFKSGDARFGVTKYASLLQIKAMAVEFVDGNGL